MVNALVPMDLMTGCQVQVSESLAAGKRDAKVSEGLRQLVEKVIKTCGVERALVIGSGEGGLVASLLNLGVDVQGVEVSDFLVCHSNQGGGDGFTQNSVLSLPFVDESFHTVIYIGGMDLLTSEQVLIALKEIHRLASHSVFLKLSALQTQDIDWSLSVEGRFWWETKCFELGFRKHTAYYKVNTIESLSQGGEDVILLLEKIPAEAILRYPTSMLSDVYGMHLDMSRESGERSDIYAVHYQWACAYIKPGDRVLDIACGSGYGSHVLAALTRAVKITGIDESNHSIGYAEYNFATANERLEYSAGALQATLAAYADNSFETIVFFDVLERVESPAALLLELKRLLVPGGRLVGSVPNNCVSCLDEGGRALLHVYSWDRLQSELSSDFIIEDVYVQTATQYNMTVRCQGQKQESTQSSSHVGIWKEQASVVGEWLLATAMKSPLESNVFYSERVFSNIFASHHPSILYSKYFIYPWLMHAMVNFEFRLKNSAALEKLAFEVMTRCPVLSNDYKAALCVLAYRILQRPDEDFGKVINYIDEVVCSDPVDPMSLRWRVSLLYVKAKLLAASGDLAGAKKTFSECSCIDVREFGVHLATKTTEAAYLAGRIACSLGQTSEAKELWQRGVAIGNNLLDVKLDSVLINPDAPNLFNHGDGAREYAVAWDNISRCANGLHLLHFNLPIDYTTLDNCHQTEYSGVTADLIATRQSLVERTGELVETRGVVVERTNELVETREVVVERTNELIQTRAVVVERTLMLEQASSDLRSCRAKKGGLWQTGVDGDIQNYAAELAQIRKAFLEQTDELVQTRKILLERTDELVQTRQTLIERTNMLERANDDLLQRSNEFAEAQQALADRTEELKFYLSSPVYKRIFVKKMEKP